MEDGTQQLKKSRNSSNSGKFVIVIFLLIVVWIFIRMSVQKSVDQYNKCFMNVSSNIYSLQNSAINSGYSTYDTTKATFDIYTDQASYCSSKLPPDWLILITGVHGR